MIQFHWRVIQTEQGTKMKHEKTFEAISKLKDVEIELHRLKNALEMTNRALETKDEPVAWMYWQSCLNDDGTQTSPWVQRYSKFKPTESVINKDITPLYTTPQRTWVGLKDEEIAEVEDEYIVDYRIPAGSAWNFAKDIEAKLKEKNT